MYDYSRHAILIGINDYKVKPLNYSSKDVSLLARALNSYCKFPEENIHTIVSTKDKSVPNVYSVFREKLEQVRSSFRTDDIFLFYFSGHGTFKNESFLEFHDISVSIQDIYDQISKLTPSNQFYLIDACYSGHGIETKGEEVDLTEYYNERFGKKADGVHFFCSSRYDQKSVAMPKVGNGMYTHILVQGMEIDGLYDEDLKSVSLVELHSYAVKRIRLDFNHEQTPFMFVKSSGYFPFAYKIAKRAIASTHFNLKVLDENTGLDLLQGNGLNFPQQFERDFSQFFSELILNLYKHNYSTLVELSIVGNTIEIFDHSKISFDPFTAQPTKAGNGLQVYRLFFDKYKDKFQASYNNGFPNIIRMEFDDTIFDNVKPNPCHIVVEQQFIERISKLNKYEFDRECSEIIIDISKPILPMSFFVRQFFDYLLERTHESQIIILKMDDSDMQKNVLREHLSEYPRYQRIMLL